MNIFPNYSILKKDYVRFLTRERGIKMEMQLIIFWLVLFVVLLVIEIATMGLTTIWFAGGALIASIAAMLGAPLPVQIVLFILVSVVLLIFTRPIATKYFNKGRTRTNAEGLIGQEAVVITEIDNLNGKGRVSVRGQEWTARTEDDSEVIATGEMVTIKAISGVKLIVTGKTEE